MPSKPRKPDLDENGEVKRPGAVNKSARARRKREAPNTRNQTKSGDYTAPIGDKICGARKQEGSICKLPSGWGTSHPGYGPCRNHYGETPMGKKGAARDMAEELMVFYGQPLDTNPIDALLDEVRRTAGHVAWLGAQIAQFKQVAVRAGKPEALTPEAEGWIRMYQSERAHLVRVSAAALNAGVNERLVQIAEHQGEKLAGAVDSILEQLNLTPVQRAMIPDVVPNVLRGLISAGLPPVVEGSTDG